jgi:hypothetical protein
VDKNAAPGRPIHGDAADRTQRGVFWGGGERRGMKREEGGSAEREEGARCTCFKPRMQCSAAQKDRGSMVGRREAHMGGGRMEQATGSACPVVQETEGQAQKRRGAGQAVLRGSARSDAKQSKQVQEATIAAKIFTRQPGRPHCQQSASTGSNLKGRRLGQVATGWGPGGEKRASYAAASKSFQPAGQDGVTGTNVKTSEDLRGAFVCGSVFKGAGVARHARKTPREIAAFKGRRGMRLQGQRVCHHSTASGVYLLGLGQGGTLSGKACWVQVEQGWALRRSRLDGGVGMGDRQARRGEWWGGVRQALLGIAGRPARC